MNSLEETTEQVVKRVLDIFNSSKLESFIGREDDKRIFEMPDDEFSTWHSIKKTPYESLVKAYQGLSDLRQVDTDKHPALTQHMNKINEGTEGILSYLEQELRALEDFKDRREQYQQNLHAGIVKIKEDYKFLAALDKKLHYYYETTFTPNMSGGPIHGKASSFTSRKLTAEEMERTLQVVEKQNLILHPVDANFGFHPAFRVAEAKKNKKTPSLLVFDEKQLPEGYSFDALSKFFLSKRNLAMMKLAGLEKPREKDHYYY